MNIQELITKYRLTGTHYHYYPLCKTKLWYYHHEILDNSENQFVQIGNTVHKESFKREEETTIGSSIVDFLKENYENGKLVLEVNEVKKTSKMTKSDKYQILHYMYLLSEDKSEITGKIRYPQENKIETVEWNSEAKRKHRKATYQIVEIISGECPPPIKKEYCNGCSMDEFCFIGGTNEK